MLLPSEVGDTVHDSQLPFFLRSRALPDINRYLLVRRWAQLVWLSVCSGSTHLSRLWRGLEQTAYM